MINIYEEFVNSYNNPEITGEDIKRLNGLNKYLVKRILQAYINVKVEVLI